MPWRETDPMKERMKFVLEAETGNHQFNQLCDAFNISCPTGYKWVDRFIKYGVEGLKDRSRRPHNPHHKMDEKIEEMILEAKLDRPHWGPKKIIAWLSQEHPETKWPVASSAGELLKRNGLVKPRKKRKRVPPYTQPFGDVEGANDSWSIDYKGEFMLANKQLCYPLTVTDNYSRYLLACDGFNKISGQRVKEVLERIFIEYGLPKVIRSDNGAPFAGRGLAGLSKLTVWWIKLGIIHERTKPGHPEQNGRHERMHRTMKAETTQPPKGNMILQQLAFNGFQKEFNEDRPHEAIDNQRPSWLHEVSPRSYPIYLPEVEYGADYTTRKIRTNGTMKWDGQEIFISETLSGERIGLLQVGEREWEIYFSTVILGVFNEESKKVSSIKS